MRELKRVQCLVWGVLLSALLIGCGGPNTSTYAPPTLAPLLTATPTVTPTPTARPTPTPTGGPTPACADSPGRVETESYYSHVLEREMTYRIYLPPCYDTDDGPYPVLYLLHGYPYNESHWDWLGADETADEGIHSGIYPPLIIVMPNGDPEGLFINTSGGDRSVEGLILNDVIPHIDGAYRTWAAREGRAVGGISRGGVWSLEIGFRNPDLFSVVGAHSAALSVNHPHPLYDPFNLAVEPDVQTLRIYLDAGDEDWART
ncbi:MAG: alpha/beta hydrolase-fold protein, partial [Anaerolineae bacterium]